MGKPGTKLARLKGSTGLADNAARRETLLDAYSASLKKTATRRWRTAQRRLSNTASALGSFLRPFQSQS